MLGFASPVTTEEQVVGIDPSIAQEHHALVDAKEADEIDRHRGRCDKEVHVEGVLTGGKRRIDKVLASNYLEGLEQLPLDEIRALRDDAGQEEADLSYLRRLLQGRIDIVTAELSRRGGGGEESGLVGDLPRILADSSRGEARGMGRHQVAEPSNTGSTRRAEEQLAAMDVTNLAEREDDEVHDLLDGIRATETDISARRRAVQGVFDAASAEITKRYRDGRADVGDLLREETAN
jgi:hypothetical protein